MSAGIPSLWLLYYCEEIERIISEAWKEKWESQQRLLFEGLSLSAGPNELFYLPLGLS